MTTRFLIYFTFIPRTCLSIGVLEIIGILVFWTVETFVDRLCIFAQAMSNVAALGSLLAQLFSINQVLLKMPASFVSSRSLLLWDYIPWSLRSGDLDINF